MGDIRNAYRILDENLNGKDHSEDLGNRVEGRRLDASGSG